MVYLGSWFASCLGSRNGRRLPALLLASLLACLGCPFISDMEGSIGDGGEVRELLPARIEHVILPEVHFAGEPVTLTMRGTHPDPCTRFERFESSGWVEGDDVDVRTWSARSVGSCPGDGETFDALQTVAGLSAGRHSFLVDETWRRRVTILSAREDLCGEFEPLEIMEVVPRGTTYVGGSAEVLVKVLHPTPCHGPPRVSHQLVDGELHLTAEARMCGPVDQGESCPDWALPLTVLHELGPVEQEEALMVFETRAGTFPVVDMSRCSFQNMLVRSVHAPALVPGEAAIPLSVRGWLPSPCAAVDEVSWSHDEDELMVEIVVRDCEPYCDLGTRSKEIEFELEIEGVPPGRWPVTVEGIPSGRDVIVAQPGACERLPLPPEAIVAALATSGLYANLEWEPVQAGRPIDVHIAGELPDGCWSEPRLEMLDAEGEVGDGGRIELSTSARFCAAACDAGTYGDNGFDSQLGGEEESDDPEDGDPPADAGDDDMLEDPIITSVDGVGTYSAGWSLPGGLPPGTFELMIDGTSRGTITVH